jgi:curved DNA-binding protein CbpA
VNTVSLQSSQNVTESKRYNSFAQRKKSQNHNGGNMAEFIDYYEILEISPNANSGTIDRIFRYLAQSYHPDNPDSGDRAHFDVIMDAYNTLKDPVKRAQYDIQHKNHSGFCWKLANEASDSKGIERDVDMQNRLLSILYVKQTTKNQRSGHRQFRT